MTKSRVVVIGGFTDSGLSGRYDASIPRTLRHCRYRHPATIHAAACLQKTCAESLVLFGKVGFDAEFRRKAIPFLLI